jgi:hypothetical protein
MGKGKTRRTSGHAELENGARMTQPEFHRLYKQMPEDFRAELIGGIVYVLSPLKRRHGTSTPRSSSATWVSLSRICTYASCPSTAVSPRPPKMITSPARRS